MPWNQPTLKTLYARIKSDFCSYLLNGARPLFATVIGVLAKVWAGACHSMHLFLAYIFKNAIPDTAESDYLRRWAAIWAVYPTRAAAAEGVALVTGKAGANVTINCWLYHQASGLRYRTLAEKRIDASGQAEIMVQAVTAGAAGNLEPGAVLKFVSPLPDVSSEAVVGEAGLSGGVAEESDESLRERLLLKIREPPHGGAKHDYAAWALETPGVTRAWVYPNHYGLGSVGVCVVNDNSQSTDSPRPDAETLARAQAYIDEVKPVTAFAVVFAPELSLCTVKVRLSPDTEAVRESVRRELADLFRREAEPGGVIPLTHIAEAVSIAAGEYDHQLVEPVANINPGAGMYPKLADVEFMGPLEAGNA